MFYVLCYSDSSQTTDHVQNWVRRTQSLTLHGQEYQWNTVNVTGWKSMFLDSSFSLTRLHFAFLSPVFLLSAVLGNLGI